MLSIVKEMILNAKRQKEIQNKHYKTYLKAKEEEMSNTVIYLDRENFNNMGKAFNSEHKDNYKFRIQTGDLDLVFFRKEEELNKMTREEAKKILAKLGTPRDTDGKYYILTVLEALGLIEFDEPPKRKYIFFPSPDAGKDNLSVYQDDAVKTMKEYGYAVGKHIDTIAYDCEIPNALAVIKDLQDRGYVIVEEVIPK